MRSINFKYLLSHIKLNSLMIVTFSKYIIYFSDVIVITRLGRQKKGLTTPLLATT
jgi:hypothetical protein